MTREVDLVDSSGVNNAIQGKFCAEPRIPSQSKSGSNPSKASLDAGGLMVELQSTWLPAAHITMRRRHESHAQTLAVSTKSICGVPLGGVAPVISAIS